MFNINQFSKVAGQSAAADIKSTTMNDILVQAEDAGKEYAAFRFEDRVFHPGQADELQISKLVFGTFDRKTNQPIEGTDLLEFNVGSQRKPLELEGESDMDKLEEVMEYPVYYGVRLNNTKNELGEDVVEEITWLTINVAGSVPNAKPATALDLAKIIGTSAKGGKPTTAPALTGAKGAKAGAAPIGAQRNRK